jgi:hypothetical protein
LTYNGCTINVTFTATPLTTGTHYYTIFPGYGTWAPGTGTVTVNNVNGAGYGYTCTFTPLTGTLAVTAP